MSAPELAGLPDLTYPEWLKLQERIERLERRRKLATAIFFAALGAATVAAWIWLAATSS